MSQSSPTNPRSDGKVAIVTGASRGIGLGIARRLVREGARVVITARHPEPLHAAVGLLGGTDRATAVAGRADDVDHQDDVVSLTTSRHGRMGS